MIQHQGVWLPDHEIHMREWMDAHGEIVEGRGTYQIKKLRAALKECKQFRVAVDVGAHVGFWSMHLIKRFAELVAFEPIAEHRLCWFANVQQPSPEHMAILLPVALGNCAAKVALTIPEGSSGGTHVSGPGEIPMTTLDHYQLENVDFLKIDCEGYELHVLEGAETTVMSSRPVVCVEQKAHKFKDFGYTRAEAVDWLQARGYRIAREMSGDYIMVPA